MRRITMDEFWKRVRKTETCWLYEGPRLPTGYGYVGKRYAHRIAYEECKGPIPEGHEIDHLCKVHNCVNPDHLEAVTQYVNLMRSDAPSATRSRQTHCVHGHPLSGDNLYIRKEGWRMCRTCIRRTVKGIKARHRAERSAAMTRAPNA